MQVRWTSKQLEESLSKPNAGEGYPSLVCVYGEDVGYAKELALKVAKQIAPDLSDPFSVDRFRVEDLLGNPSLLIDSLQTLTFGVSCKLVFLEGVSKDLPTNQTSQINNMLIDSLPYLGESAKLVFAAGGYDNKDKVIKEIEASPLALGVRCFLDSAQDLRDVIVKHFAGSSQKVQPDAIHFLCENLGNDRAVTRSELEKLSLYTQGHESVTLDDCLTMISAAPSLNVFKLCDAIGLREREKAERYLRVLGDEGVDAATVLAMVIRHMRRLMQAHEFVKQGKSADQAIMSLQPPVFYGKAEFKNQMKIYPEKRLYQSLERLYALQLESRQGALDSDLAVARGVLAMAF